MHRLKHIILILFVALMATSCAVDKNLKRGEQYLALGEYYDAANEFKRAYSKTSPKEKQKRGERAKKMTTLMAMSFRTL